MDKPVKFLGALLIALLFCSCESSRVVKKEKFESTNLDATNYNNATVKQGEAIEYKIKNDSL